MSLRTEFYTDMFSLIEVSNLPEDLDTRATNLFMNLHDSALQHPEFSGRVEELCEYLQDKPKYMAIPKRSKETVTEARLAFEDGAKWRIHHLEKLNQPTTNAQMLSDEEAACLLVDISNNPFPDAKDLEMDELN